MKRVLVGDSCVDLNEALKQRVKMSHIPFPINVGEKSFWDDEHLNMKEFLQALADCEETAKTAAPSPAGFLDALGDAAEGFIITITSKLSSCYSNASLAARQWVEAKKERRVHVFDSRSASVGETALAVKVQEWMDENLDFDEIVQRGEAFIDSMHTFFVLEDLSTLVKSGRIPKLAGRIVDRLAICPVCTAENGEIKVSQIRRGIKGALSRMAKMVGETMEDFSDRVLYITHVNCPQRAEQVKAMILERANFRDCQIVEAGGLSATYANDGGIIVAY